MADEELRISVKVDQEKAAENTRLLKDSFRSITDVQHVQRFEALGRQFQLTDTQLKQLGTAILKPNDALSGFAAGFGRAGTILLAFDAAVAVAKAVITTFSDAASRQLDISNAAKRMGNIHAAQLDANVHAMERERIERGRGIAMMENFSRRRAEFLEHNSQFRRSIMEDVEGPFADVVRRHFAELEQEVDPTKMMNLVRRFAEEIEKYYKERGKPGDAERGAQEKRKYLERWFGLPDIAQLTTDFLKVTKETEEAWDRNQKAAEEFWRVTTDISNNFSKIVSSVLTQTMDDLGVGTLLRTVNAFLERGVKEHDEIGVMSPEERAKYLDSLVREGGAAWRKAIIDLLFNASPASHAFPRPGGRPGAPQRLLEDLNDKQTDLITEEKRLVENLQFLNALLSGESGIGGQKPAFHNAPMGGAEGESNPMQLPAGIAQPGGGAAAEARKQFSIREQAQQALDEIRASQGTPAPGTPLPQRRPPGASISSETAGPLAALGASYVGNRTYAYDDPRITNPKAKASIARGDFGFSYTGSAAPEAYYQPGSGQEISTTAHEYEHVGRAAVRTGALGGKSLEPNVLKRYGAYVEPSFADKEAKEERQQRYQEIITSRKLYETGQISAKEQRESFNETTAYLSAIGGSKYDAEEAGRHSEAQQRYAQLMLGSKVWSRSSADYAAEKAEQDLPLPGGMATSANRERSGLDAGRRRLDRDMDDEMDVSGRLNVSVDAPAGTEVKANGGGMFENNVSVDRRMGFEE